MFKIRHPRFKHMYMFFGSIFVVLLYVLIDPRTHILQDLPFGASTIVLIAELLKAMWYIAMLHMSIYAMFDYVKIEKFFEKAYETSTGAGLALIAVSVQAIGVAIAIAAAVLSN